MVIVVSFNAPTQLVLDTLHAMVWYP